MAKTAKNAKSFITAKEVKDNLVKAAALLNHPSMQSGASGRHFAANPTGAMAMESKASLETVTTVLYQAYCNTIGENIGNATSDQDTANSEANQHRLQTGHSVNVITSVK